MRKKRLATGSIAILALTTLLLVFIFFNPYKLNSTLEFTSEHLFIGALLLISLRMLGNVFPVIPGGMIAFATVPVLGWFTAFICNTAGILLGGMIAFFLARTYREPLVSRFASLSNIHKLEKQISGKKQFVTLVAFKLFTVPVVDISSYIVGLTKISFIKFISATFLATLPTLAGFYFGFEAYRTIFGKNMFIGIISILILSSIYLILKKIRLKRRVQI